MQIKIYSLINLINGKRNTVEPFGRKRLPLRSRVCAIISVRVKILVANFKIKKSLHVEPNHCLLDFGYTKLTLIFD